MLEYTEVKLQENTFKNLYKLHHQITTLKWRCVKFSVYMKTNKICLRESKKYQMSIAISTFNAKIYWYKKLAYGKDIYTALDLFVQFYIVNKCNLYFRNVLQSQLSRIVRNYSWKIICLVFDTFLCFTHLKIFVTCFQENFSFSSN